MHHVLDDARAVSRPVSGSFSTTTLRNGLVQSTAAASAAAAASPSDAMCVSRCCCACPAAAIWRYEALMTVGHGLHCLASPQGTSCGWL